MRQPLDWPTGTPCCHNVLNRLGNLSVSLATSILRCGDFEFSHRIYLDLDDVLQTQEQITNTT